MLRARPTSDGAHPTRRASSTSAPAVARADVTRKSARSRSRREQAPLPPWGRFPLVELCVLSAIGLAVAGAIVRGHAGGVLLVGAALLGSVAGLEVALREHLGGYRSHTTLLAGVGAIGTMALLHFGPRLDRETIVPVAVVVFGLGFIGWRALFKKRSGGFGVKVR